MNDEIFSDLCEKMKVWFEINLVKNWFFVWIVDAKTTDSQSPG